MFGIVQILRGKTVKYARYTSPPGSEILLIAIPSSGQLRLPRKLENTSHSKSQMRKYIIGPIKKRISTTENGTILILQVNTVSGDHFFF